MIIAVGEILIDHFPDYQRAGGAPFNFIYHLKKLGMAARLISRIGDDAAGKLIQRLFSRNGFDLADLQIDPDKATGAVGVTLDDAGVPTFNILPDTAYDYLQLHHLSGRGVATDPALIYYGSLIQRSDHGLHQVGQFLRNRGTTAKCFCDINLRAPHYSRESVEQCLQYADVLKLNDQELADIWELWDTPVPVAAFAKYLMSRYQIEMLAITRGPDGSTLITEKHTITTPSPHVSEIIDTVGAGDGFAAILAYGTLRALPLEKIALTANAFAAQICQHSGAIIEDDAFYSFWKAKLGERP